MLLAPSDDLLSAAKRRQYLPAGAHHLLVTSPLANQALPVPAVAGGGLFPAGTRQASWGHWGAEALGRWDAGGTANGSSDGVSGQIQRAPVCRSSIYV